MKHSKIFLGATALLLAIAGFAARKHAFTGKTGFYSTVGNPNVCNKVSAAGFYTTVQTGTEHLATVKTSVSHQLYKFSSCSSPMFTTALD